MKKKRPIMYYYGKGIKKTISNRSPIYGEPNSNIDFRGIDDGTLHRRRKIGYNGVAIKDYDSPDQHKPYIHVHDFVGEVRSPEDRPPTKREAREYNKARSKKKKW